MLSPDLAHGVRVGVPIAAPRFGASVSDQHLAVVSLDEVVVCDRQGSPRWRRVHAIERAGLPCEPNCHLDAQGVLWVYLPHGDEDELVAYQAATGDEIARTELDAYAGAAYFWPHPDRSQLGLHVAMGQDTPRSFLAWLDDARITGRELLGECLNGFTSSGQRYLTLPHDGRDIAIRDLATGAAVVACDRNDIPGYHRTTAYALMEAAALVSDDYALVAVAADDSGFEEHLVLSTRTLRWQTDVDYGHTVTQNSIAATDGRGRWITSRSTDDTMRLWQLPDSIPETMPGQLPLW